MKENDLEPWHIGVPKEPGAKFQVLGSLLPTSNRTIGKLKFTVKIPHQ
jgi:hypothetical protein